MDMKIILTKKQAKQIRSLFKEGVVATDQVEIIVSRTTGIGQNMYVRYVDDNLRIREIDISDYESW